MHVKVINEFVQSVDYRSRERCCEIKCRRSARNNSKSRNEREMSSYNRATFFRWLWCNRSTSTRLWCLCVKHSTHISTCIYILELNLISSKIDDKPKSTYSTQQRSFRLWHNFNHAISREQQRNFFIIRNIKTEKTWSRTDLLSPWINAHFKEKNLSPVTRWELTSIGRCRLRAFLTLPVVWRGQMWAYIKIYQSTQTTTTTTTRYRRDGSRSLVHKYSQQQIHIENAN